MEKEELNGKTNNQEKIISLKNKTKNTMNKVFKFEIFYLD